MHVENCFMSSSIPGINLFSNLVSSNFNFINCFITQGLHESEQSVLPLNFIKWWHDSVKRLDGFSNKKETNLKLHSWRCINSFKPTKNNEKEREKYVVAVN